MKKYLCVKLVEAEVVKPINKWDNEGYKVKEEDLFYWVAKEDFERDYIEVLANTTLTPEKRRELSRVECEVDKKDEFDFGVCIHMLKSGCKMSRKRWGYHGNNIYLQLQVPNEHSKMTEPFIYMYKEVDGKITKFPVELSCESYMAEDWIVVE